MQTIDPEMLAEVQRFSDWRIYRLDNSASCALEGVNSQQSSLTLDQQRRWLRYQVLSTPLQAFCDLLHGICAERGQPWSCFGLDFTDGARSLRFRIQEMGVFFACKRILTDPTNLEDLKVPESVLNLVTSRKFRATGGLMLSVGDAGTGKTMFASAVMRERLKQMGGYCLVLGDPPEQPLADKGGNKVGANGYVDEVDVSEIGYTAALAHALRSFPVGASGSFFYGEIRSGSNAFDVINASCDGHEIYSTMHGMTPDAALDRLISWGVRGGVPVDLVRSMLAQSLFGIVSHRVANGRFHCSAHLATEATKARIREGHPLPFQATAPLIGIS